MRIQAFAVFAGFLIGLAGCAGPRTTWQDFRMPGADVAISMPGEPKLSVDSTEKDGTKSRQYLVDQGSIAYGLHYTIIPAVKKGQKEASLDAVLDGSRDGVVRGVDGAKLRNERRFALGDCRATELILDVAERKDSPAYVMKLRLYVRRDQGHRIVLYQALVVGPKGYDANANVARFLDSFHFVTG